VAAAAWSCADVG
jgi:hypothetical protein